MRIPVKIYPGFFVTSAILGFLITNYSFIGTLIMMGVIFISILVHEYGHALFSLLFGQNPRIELIAFGGVTIPSGKSLKPWQEFVMILAGPLFGFLLFVAALLLYQMPIENELVRKILFWTYSLNLFWTFINLLPIIPLDGGQLIRVILQKIFGVKGWKIALIFSASLSFLLAATLFLYGQFLGGAVFTLFAFQNIDFFRRIRYYSDLDQDEELAKNLESIHKIKDEKELKSSLTSLLDRLNKKTSTQTIAKVKAMEAIAKIEFNNNPKEAYRYFEMVEDLRKLSPEGLYFYFLSAFQSQDYLKVILLSKDSLEFTQDVRVYVYSAIAYLNQGKQKEAVEWMLSLKDIVTHEHMQEILQEEAFASIRTLVIE